MEETTIDSETEPTGEAPTSSKPVALTLTEAAEACKTSKSTMVRRRSAGDFPNAFREGGAADGPWLIPVTDLIAAGFELNSSTPVIDLTDDTPVAEPSRTHQLELMLERERGKTERWMAVAEERDRTISGFEMAMRVLPGATAVEMPAAARAAVSAESRTKPDPVFVTDRPPRRGLFRRRQEA